MGGDEEEERRKRGRRRKWKKIRRGGGDFQGGLWEGDETVGASHQDMGGT